VLLSLDALVHAGARRHAGAAAAGEEEATRVLAAAAALRPAFLDGGGALCGAARRGVVRIGTQQASLEQQQQQQQQPLVTRAPAARPLGRLWPPAAVAPAAGALTFELLDDDVDEEDDGSVVSMHARLGGHALRCRVVRDATAAAGAPGRRRLELQLRGGGAGSAAEEGAVLLEREARAAGSAHGAAVSAPRVVLLCADADIVAQVTATCEALRSDAAADEALQRCLRVAGEALMPRAPPRVRRAAAAAAVWLGWDALLSRLLADSGDADDAPALLLCAAAHVAACRRSGGGGSCSPAVDALVSRRTAAAWPAAACARAAALLRAADADGAHARADCAVAAAAAAAAATPSDARAAALLRALLRLLLDAPADDADDSDDEENNSAASSAALHARVHEASYAHWLARRSAVHMLAASLLSALGNAVQLLNLLRSGVLNVALNQAMTLRSMDLGAATARMVAACRLHPRGAAPYSPLDMPLAPLVPYMRVYVAATLARVPAQLALIALVRAVRRGRHVRHFEALVYGCLLADVAVYLLADALVLRATSAALEWPMLPCMLYGIGIAIGSRSSPFRLRCTRLYICARLAAAVAALAYVCAWRVLLSPGVASQLLALAVWAATARGADAAQREEHAALRAAQRRACDAPAVLRAAAAKRKVE
jgi:hypothetical protein